MGIDAVLKRDRWVVLGGIAGLTALAWAYMIREAQAMSLTGACCLAGMKMSGPDMTAWAPATLIPLFLMWTEMMAAMMLPSAAPMILTFAMVNRKRREKSQPYVPTAIFAAGYLAAWTAFSGVAALAQWALHGAALLSPAMVANTSMLSGILLLAAGIFQWTPLKNSCLTHCRSPLSFLLESWKDGRLGALWMGFKHGLYCTGCCWVLMALLFVVGVMNMWWVAAIAIFVLIEKAAPQGLWIGRILGLVMGACGVGMMAAAQSG